MSGLQDPMRVSEHLVMSLREAFPMQTIQEMAGLGGVVALRLYEDGKLVDLTVAKNLITTVGDQFFASRAAGVSPLAAITGMRYGTGGATPAAKSGAGSFIASGTYVSGSAIVLDSGTSPNPAVTSLANDSGYQITYTCKWLAGTATVTVGGISEVVLTNETTPSGSGNAGNTIARATPAATFKQANQDLLVVWNQVAFGQ